MTIAHDAQPPEDHDDTAEAHYACLERPHACMGGWVFVGYIETSMARRGKSPTPAAVARKKLDR